MNGPPLLAKYSYPIGIDVTSFEYTFVCIQLDIPKFGKARESAQKTHSQRAHALQFLQCMCGVVPAYQNQKYARKLSKCIEQYNTERSCNGHSISFFFLHTFFFIPSSLRLHLDACCRFLSFKGRDNRIFVKCLFFFCQWKDIYIQNIQIYTEIEFFFFRDLAWGYYYFSLLGCRMRKNWLYHQHP